jgi:hypothetical protein
MWTITAIRDGTTDDPEQERVRIGQVEASLSVLGISVEWTTHGTGAGAISAEWLTVVFAGSQKPTGFKISVANRFEVNQELSRVADLLQVRCVDLTVFPRPGGCAMSDKCSCEPQATSLQKYAATSKLHVE